jgi:hypothetical protein
VVLDGKQAVADVMVRRPKVLGAQATVSDAITFFSDDHAHLALVVAEDRRLLTSLERADIPPGIADTTPITELGILAGRTVSPFCPVPEATAAMSATGRRRLAVVGDDGELLGLLCLKASRDGFCSDEGITSRAADRGSRPPDTGRSTHPERHHGRDRADPEPECPSSDKSQGLL